MYAIPQAIPIQEKSNPPILRMLYRTLFLYTMLPRSLDIDMPIIVDKLSPIPLAALAVL